MRLVRSIRASTAASPLVAVAVSDLAPVRLRHAHDSLDGGAETEEETEVHDPVCVEFPVEVVASAAADEKTEADLDSEARGLTRRAPQLFVVLVDGAAFV